MIDLVNQAESSAIACHGAPHRGALSTLLLDAHRAVRDAATAGDPGSAVCSALRASRLFGSVTLHELPPAGGPGVLMSPVTPLGRSPSWLVCRAAHDETTPALRAALDAIAQLLGLALDSDTLAGERVQAQRNVERVFAEQRQVLDELEDGYYEVDLQGGAIFLNAAFTRMLGYTREELGIQDYRDRQSPEMTARITGIFTEVYRSGRPQASNFWDYTHKDGHAVQVEASVQLMRDAAGVPRGFRGIVREVTERRQVDAALRDHAT